MSQAQYVLGDTNRWLVGLNKFGHNPGSNEIPVIVGVVFGSLAEQYQSCELSQVPFGRQILG